MGDLDARLNAEAEARGAEDKLLNERIDKIVSEREEKMSSLQTKTDKQNEERIADLDNLRTKMETENMYMEAVASKTMGVYFSAFRNGAYSGGGENLTFNGAYCNTGGALDVESGVFTCPVGKISFICCY